MLKLNFHIWKIVFIFCTPAFLFSQNQWQERKVDYAGNQQGVHITASGQLGYKHSTTTGTPNAIYGWKSLNINSLRINGEYYSSNSGPSEIRRLFPIDFAKASNTVSATATFMNVGYRTEQKSLSCSRLGSCELYFKDFRSALEKIPLSEREPYRKEWLNSYLNTKWQIVKLDDTKLGNLIREINRLSGNTASNSNSSNSSQSSSTSPRQATSLEEIRRRQAAAQNRGNSSSGSQRSAAEVQREQIRRQQQRQSNSGSSAKKSSSSASSGGNSSARRSSTNTRAEQQHKYRQQEQRAQAQREQQALAQRQHQEAMAQLGAAAILVHLTLGYLIYEQGGDVNGRESAPRGNGVHHQLSAGYNLSYFDLLNDDIDLDPITIDFGLTYRLNLLQSDHFGLGLRADASAGHSLLFDTRFAAGWGANAYLGFKNFRLFTELQGIDHTLWATEERTLRWRYHRLSFGPQFSWNNNLEHLKLLFQWDYFRLPEDGRRINAADGLGSLPYSVGSGFRFEYLRRNKLQVFAQYNPLVANPNRSFREEGQPLGAHYSLGIRRTWDWHKTGSLDYDYSRLRGMNHNADIYVSVMNPVMEWGGLTRGEDEFQLDGPQLSFNFVSLEGQIGLYEDLYLSLGAGLSGMRRMSGNFRYAPREGPGDYTLFNEATGEYEIESFFPLGDPTIRAFKLNRYSLGELELPLGLQYFFPSAGEHRYWAAAKMVPAFSLGEGGDELEENIYRDFQLFYRLGLGVDIPYTSSGNMRWGLYYLMRPNSFTWENIDQNLHGLQLQMAYGF